MADRDAPDDFKDHLAGELEGWARDGLIAPEQAQAILARYALRPGALRAFRLGPVATLISVVGALVLAMGVIYFFAANWSLLPAWSKIALVYAGVGTSYGAGYILQFRRQTLPRVGASLLLLGALLFQAGFFLLAQICNMPVNSPILLLLGAVGILPLAYLVRSRLVLTLGLADALTWLGWQLADRYQSAPESFAVALVYMLAGIVVYSAGQLHRQRRSFTNFVAVYGVLGLLAVFLPAYVLSFGYFWKEAASSGITSLRVPLRFVGALVLALLAAASLLLPLQSWRRLGTENRRDPLLLAEVAVFAIIALAVGLVAFVPRWAGGYAVVFNLVFFGLASFASVRGYLEGEARFVNLGIGFIAAGLVTRYVDTFWGLLPLSGFFVIGGLVPLVVAGALERLQRNLLSCCCSRSSASSSTRSRPGNSCCPRLSQSIRAHPSVATMCI